MKTRLLIMFFVVLSNLMYAQKEYDVREDGNSYAFVDSLKINPDIAYNNAQDWLVKSSTSYKSSVQFENKEQRKIIAKSGVAYPYSTASNDEHFLIFDLTIELKEGKFRLKFDNIKQYTILHAVNLGFTVTDEDVSEADIVTCSCYDKDLVTGVVKFRYEDEYKLNKSLLEELQNKKSTIKKKKELAKIEQDISRLKDQQKFIDDCRDNYLKINKTINDFVAFLSQMLNTDDDF